MIMVNHAYTSATTDVPEDRYLLSKVLVCVDMDSGATEAFVFGTGEANIHALQRVMGWLAFLGHDVVDVRADSAPYFQHCRHDLHVAMTEADLGRTILSNGPLL